MKQDQTIRDLCREARPFLSRRPHYVYVRTFGCQQNAADGEKMLGMAVEMGYLPCDDPARADLILVNTCAVREHAELRVLSVIGSYRHLREANPDLIIGVAGCMTARTSRVEQLRRSYPYVTFTLAPGRLSDLPRCVLRALRVRAGAERGSRRSFCLPDEALSVEEGIPALRAEAHRAWVPIMYGCNNFCSYCIVPYVRGRERSRDAADIIDEVRCLVDEGAKEITLLGQNVNSYRGDVDFAGLLERLADLPGDFRIHFMTSHPKDVPDDLIRVMAAHPGRISSHFHLPLQSGSDRILRAMNRRYDVARYRDVVRRLREAMPDVSLTTDIIVGFPGETAEDYEATLDRLREFRFDLVYAFIYSPREGTKAALLPDAIPEEEKKRRVNHLLEVQTAIAAECAARHVGKTLRVLVDERSKAGENVWSARTVHNTLVHFKSDADLTGRWATVRITDADAFALYGELLDPPAAQTPPDDAI